MKKTKGAIVGLLVVLLLGGFVCAASAGDNENDALPGSAPLLVGASDQVAIEVALEKKAEDELVTYNVRVPKVVGLADEALMGQLNDTILERAKEDIESVETQASEFAAMAEKEGWEKRPYEVYIDFAEKANQGVLSFVVNTYMYAGGANGITRVDTYNIDVDEGVELQLADLFVPDADYKQIISDEILAQMRIKEELEEAMYFTGEEGFKTIADKQDFYIEDKNLVILFQKYEIAPGAMGTPEFAIPLENLNDILRATQQTLKYMSVTGVVQEVVQNGENTTLWLEEENGNPANVVVSPNTYVVDGAEITVGAKVIAFYDANRPMILIYPPLYSADVVALVKEGENIKVDKFDLNLVSSDNMLKINSADSAEVISQDGLAFDGGLANRKLVVVYGPATKSIPAQTNPVKVVVLFEKATPPMYEFMDVSQMDILVSDKKVEAPKAFNNEQGITMVPIRAICEALGLEVNWDEETRSVAVGENILLFADKDSYYKAADMETKLGVAPEIREDRLFVPLKFFKEIVGMNNAYVFEGQIVIDNNEVMH